MAERHTKRFDHAVEILLNSRHVDRSVARAFWAYVDGDDDALDGFI